MLPPASGRTNLGGKAGNSSLAKSRAAQGVEQLASRKRMRDAYDGHGSNHAPNVLLYAPPFEDLTMSADPPTSLSHWNEGLNGDSENNLHSLQTRIGALFEKERKSMNHELIERDMRIAEQDAQLKKQEVKIHELSMKSAQIGKIEKRVNDTERQTG
ncbi:hypothetical protein CC80DRAFT_554619 [Byssothecium circinans]|uniref:Uncharacterized protein n=1 Tax=Byssothecium circinans TaxID=147558 RepID=A0A6A5TEI0_9PLEO|nr:hypothetical protein CC80DRAFT_554619 [Byssothecium circinans]